MNVIPRVACINDISGFGRCSLTTAIAILSAAGVQACPVPTAVLSKHTGFPSFTFHDLTGDMPKYFDTWDDIPIDAVYSGFLGSPKQIDIVSEGDRVVIVGGLPLDTPGNTNMIKVETVKSRL